MMPNKIGRANAGGPRQPRFAPGGRPRCSPLALARLENTSEQRIYE